MIVHSKGREKELRQQGNSDRLPKLGASVEKFDNKRRWKWLGNLMWSFTVHTSYGTYPNLPTIAKGFGVVTTMKHGQTTKLNS